MASGSGAGGCLVALLLWSYCLLQCDAVDYSTVLQQAFDECIESSAFGISSGKLPNSQMWASSASLKRQASSGRLFQNSAWQSLANDYTQWLSIDLGSVMLVTSVSTQGFRGSRQYVSNYYFYYSNDNATYVPIVDDLGQPMMFDGNTDDDMPVRNYFQYPVIARYVRFSPQRWNIQIAMRVEVYGCVYTPSTAQFDGNSAITFDASTPNTLYTVVDFSHYRFKTNNPQGVLFYASGNQGDYVGFELVDGLLYLTMSLGGSYDGSTTRGSRAVVGSLLDDNQWHDVQFYRREKNVTVWVDRVPVNVTLTGNFYRLDLDRTLWLGGVQTFYQPGLTAVTNFVGCIENFVWNGIYMSRDAKAGLQRFGTMGSVIFTCQLPATDTISFSTPQAYAVVSAKTSLATSSLSLAFDFRTYDTDTAVFSSTLGRDGYVRLFVNPLGNIQYELRVTLTDMIFKDYARNDKNSGSYTDGLWHKVVFVVQRNKVNLTVDGKAYITDAQVNPGTVSSLTLGGTVATKRGFLGCMRNVFVNGDKVDFSPPPNYDGPVSSAFGVNLDTCALLDRCHPNPCEHGGRCVQTYSAFSCDCTGTGYMGATCHQSQYKTSCSRIFELTNYKALIQDMIDVDGSGGLAPFPVTCIQNAGDIETHVSHDTTDETLVNGFQPPGSYARTINYVTNITQLDQLIYRASSCRQYISYKCTNSRLLQNPGSQSYDPTQNVDGRGQASIQQYEAWGWWFGRNYQNNYYWGGAAPGTQKCQCGLQKSCVLAQTTCNCDAALGTQVIDDGYLQTKEHLPVLVLRFGDTGSLDDAKQGYHQLGPLICVGDSLFDKPVTFRKQDALVYFTTFWSRDVLQMSSWDIGFRFKTTTDSGVFVNQVGPEDFVEVRLISATSLSFRFSAGYGVQAITVFTAFQLNDNNWHQVYAERNRLQSLLMIDEQTPSTVLHPANVAYRPFIFSSPMVVGAGVDYADGYVGCMSSLQNNGEILNLYEKVSSGEFTYGLSLGCSGKCDSNPCLNGGICYEYYYMFYCDCSYTPFRGLICGREVGVSLFDAQMLVYEIPVSNGSINTDSENITVGFITRKKPRFLLQIGDSYGEASPPNNYITFEINNEGGIRVSFKLSTDRYQMNTQGLASRGIDLTNGQPHIVKFRRLNRGTLLILQVDDYPVTTLDMSSTFPQGSDTRLDNVKYIVMGKNFTVSGPDTSTFEGCLFRVQFDNNWPLKRIYQDPRPSNVDVKPSFDSIREDKCGFEEILPPREPEEVRPTFEPPPAPATAEGQQAVDDQNSGVNSAIIGVLLGVVAVILIVIVAVFIWKCKREREKNYEYEEDDEEDENFELEGVLQPLTGDYYGAGPAAAAAVGTGRQYAGTPAGSRHSSTAASEGSDGGGGRKKDEWFI